MFRGRAVRVGLGFTFAEGLKILSLREINCLTSAPGHDDRAVRGGYVITTAEGPKISYLREIKSSASARNLENLKKETAELWKI